MNQSTSTLNGLTREVKNENTNINKMTSSTPRIVPQKQAQLSFTSKRKEPNQSINSNPSQIENQNKDIQHVTKKTKLNSPDLDPKVANDNEIRPRNDESAVKTLHILSNSQISNQIPVKNSYHSTEDDAESENESELLPENLRTKYLSTYKFLSYESTIKKLYCGWCKKAGLINVLSKEKKYPLDKTIM